MARMAYTEAKVPLLESREKTGASNRPIHTPKGS